MVIYSQAFQAHSQGLHPWLSIVKPFRLVINICSDWLHYIRGLHRMRPQSSLSGCLVAKYLDPFPKHIKKSFSYIYTMRTSKNSKTEDLEPKDSEQKKIRPEDGQEAVVKPEDKQYRKKEANFKNPAKSRERSEQPVLPIKKAPKNS